MDEPLYDHNFFQRNFACYTDKHGYVYCDECTQECTVMDLELAEIQNRIARFDNASY